jgi:hypothetical protein
MAQPGSGCALSRRRVVDGIVLAQVLAVCRCGLGCLRPGAAMGVYRRYARKTIGSDKRMPIVTTSIANFIIVVAMGIVIGIVFNRYGRGWLGRKFADATGVGDITYALVGISGSFMGFHVAFILGLLPAPLLLYVGAVIGAALTLWLWRGR